MSKKYITDVIKINGQLIDGNGSAGTSGQVLSSTGTATDWVSLSEISGVDGTGTANYIAKWSDGDTITTSAIYDNGTNVGIGTAAPTEKLQVNGAIRIPYNSTNTNFFIQDNGSVGFGKMTPFDNSGFYSFDANYTSNGGYKFKYNGSEKLRITSSGNVGIGTTNPDASLHVTTDSAAGTFRLSPQDGTYEDYRLDIRAQASDAGALTMKFKDNTFLKTYGYYNLTGVSHGVAGYEDLLHLKNTGNVGIGTTSPAYKLDILGSSPFLRINNTAETNAGILFQDSADAGQSAAIKYNSSDNSLSFSNFSYNTERMRITSGGNVGIGTTSPQSKLHLATTGGSTLTIQNTTNSGNAALNFRDEGDNDQFQIYYALGANRSYNLVNGNGLTIYSSQSSSEIARFGNASSGYTDSYFTGNVGIGTTSPFKNLNLEWDSSSVDPQTGEGLSGGVAGKGVLLRNSNATVGTFANLDFRANNADARIAYTHNATNNGDFHFILDNTTSNPLTRLFIEGETGNVGVGTTSPTFKLHTVGNGYFTNNLSVRNSYNGQALNVGGNIYTIAGSNWVNDGYAFVSASATTTGMYPSSINGIQFKVAGSEKVRINSTGNVGIGTTSPEQKLTLSEITGSTALGLYNTNSNADNRNWAISSNTITYGDLSFLQSNVINGNPVSAGVSRLYINKSGNVGIGTTSPGHKLDVYTNTDNGYVARFSQDNATGWGVLIDTDGVSNNDPALWVKNATSTVLWAAQSGNVGIGTTPVTGRKLDVDGHTMVRGNLFIGDTLSTASEHKIKVGQNRSGNGYAYIDLIGDSSALSGYNLRLIRNNTGANATSQIVHTGTGNFSIDTSDSANIILNPGNANVGIGTTSPGVTLQVGDGTTDTTSRFYYSDNTYTQINGYGLFMSRTSSYIRPTTDNALTLYIGTNSLQWNAISMDASTILFDVNGSESMRIDSSGNVGIGTTSPSSPLNIRSTGNRQIHLSDTSDSTSQGLFLGYDSAGNVLSYIGSSYNSDVSRIDFRMKGLAEGDSKMSILGSGNVGIGTTNPGAKLEVDGDVKISLDNQLTITRSGIGSLSSDSCIYVDNTYTGFGNPSNIDSDISSQYGSRHIVFRYNGNIVGNIVASGTSGVAYSTSASDERLKKNIEDWQENILDKFEQIEPKKFNFITEDEGEDKTKGFIAQKMVDNFPEAYPSDYSEEKYHSFNPSGMVVYLMKAVKELVEKNKELENRIQTLENK